MLFTGRLTEDAKVRNVKNDKKVTGFTVAINQRYKTKDGEKKEKSAFVVCSCWVNPGLAEYLKKGTIVEVSGWMEAQGWKNRDGEAQGTLVCSVDTIRLFGKASERTAGNAKGTEKQGAAAGTPNEDDLPF